MRVLTHSFYKRDPLTVAQELLGKVLVRAYSGQSISGRIIETEAYLAFTDEAAHSFRGRTKSNLSLFGAAGFAYVHSIHSQYCLDVVTESVDIPSSVLIRALMPLSGVELMKAHRKKSLIKDLTDGPGKLCQALMIRKELDGINLTDSSSQLYIASDGYEINPNDIVRTKRIGLSKAIDSEYRFYIPLKSI